MGLGEGGVDVHLHAGTLDPQQDFRELVSVDTRTLCKGSQENWSTLSARRKKAKGLTELRFIKLSLGLRIREVLVKHRHRVQDIVWQWLGLRGRLIEAGRDERCGLEAVKRYKVEGRRDELQCVGQGREGGRLPAVDPTLALRRGPDQLLVVPLCCG